MIEWFCMFIVMEYYSTLLCIFDIWILGGGEALQLHLVRVFRKSPFVQKWLQNTFFFIKFLEFTTIFWISITELFVAMNSVTERNINNGFIYNYLWHSNNMNVILPNFCSGSLFFNSLNFELCWLYSFFLYWLFPYSSQSSQIV